MVLRLWTGLLGLLIAPVLSQNSPGQDCLMGCSKSGQSMLHCAKVCTADAPKDHGGKLVQVAKNSPGQDCLMGCSKSGQSMLHCAKVCTADAPKDHGGKLVQVAKEEAHSRVRSFEAKYQALEKQWADLQKERVRPGATTRKKAHEVRGFHVKYRELEEQWEENWLATRKAYAAKACLEDDPDEDVQMAIAFAGGCAREGTEERSRGEEEWVMVERDYELQKEHLDDMRKMIDDARTSSPLRQFFHTSRKAEELAKTKKRGEKLLRGARKELDSRKKEDGWSTYD